MVRKAPKLSHFDLISATIFLFLHMFILNLKSYKIYIGSIGEPLKEIAAEAAYSKIAVLVDPNTSALCLPYFLEQLGFAPIIIEIPAGELFKNLETCQQVWGQLMANGLDRKSLLFNLGGGVIGDLGGFCAATYLRGIDFVQVPTTLLAQVDASVGGKLGVDFNLAKNSIGVFQNPRAVLVDPCFLGTLPEQEIRSGFAEVLKHALIADAQQWAGIQKIASLQGVDWAALLAPSLSIKQRIVEEDPTEKGIRKALNFGHTVGHAVESYSLASDSRPALTHGEAVAIGIVCETWLSHQLLGLPEADLQSVTSLVKRFYRHYPIPKGDFPAIFEWMRKDKKNERGRINFTLVPAIGQASIDHYCEEGLVEEALVFYLHQAQ